MRYDRTVLLRNAIEHRVAVASNYNSVRNRIESLPNRLVLRYKVLRYPMKAFVFAPVLLLAWLALPVKAQTLEQVRAQLDHAEYDDAERSATALLRESSLDAAQRNEVLELLATAQYANGHQAPARDTMRVLFSRDPQHRLVQNDPSPPIVAAFSRVREQHPPALSIALRADVAASVTDDNACTVRVDARVDASENAASENASAVQEMILYYRAESSPTSDGTNPSQTRLAPFTRIIMHASGSSWEANIPADRQRTRIAYYIEAIAPSRMVLASAASAASPTQHATAWPTTVTDGSSNAWVWAVVIGSVVLVAGGVVAGVLLSQDGPPQGTLGSITLIRM